MKMTRYKQPIRQREWELQNNRQNKNAKNLNWHICHTAIGVQSVSKAKEEQTTTQDSTANKRWYTWCFATSKHLMTNKYYLFSQQLTLRQIWHWKYLCKSSISSSTICHMRTNLPLWMWKSTSHTEPSNPTNWPRELPAGTPQSNSIITGKQRLSETITGLLFTITRQHWAISQDTDWTSQGFDTTGNHQLQTDNQQSTSDSALDDQTCCISTQ